MLFGVCQGHNKLADGTYIHTSPVVKMELCEEGIDAHTYSGTHYKLQTQEVALEFLEETKHFLKLEEIDTSFLDDVAEQIETVQKQKEQEVDKLLEENDLYLEFVGTHMKYGYFKKDGELIALHCYCHVGMFDDSYLIRNMGVVDVRYFKKENGISFYHVSDGIHNIHFKYVGKVPFTIRGIGEALEFTQDDAEIKTIQPLNCNEGLFSPDCVNGKSFFSSSDDEDVDSMPTMEEWYNSLSDEERKELDDLVGKGDAFVIPIEETNMYKVVLYDVNTTAFVTSAINYYTDDIEDFQNRWFALEENENSHACFLRSKAGEYASNIYNITHEEYQKLQDNEKEQYDEYNMVQYSENCKCVFQQTVNFENLEAIVTNGFGCETKYYMKDIAITYKYICFNDKYVKIAKFKAKGVCSDSVCVSEGYVNPMLFGNRVIEISDTLELPYKSQDKSVYDEVTAELIAYKELEVFETFAEAQENWLISLVTDSELDILFQDFVGDAG